MAFELGNLPVGFGSSPRRAPKEAALASVHCVEGSGVGRGLCRSQARKEKVQVVCWDGSPPFLVHTRASSCTCAPVVVVGTGRGLFWDRPCR